MPLALAATALPGDARRDELVVRDDSGRQVVRAELPKSDQFALAYRHSYHAKPARELFAAEDGALRLRALASPSAAVLDYYALPGRRTRRRGWLRLVPDEQRSYERLPLIATEVGRRTLLVGERRIPLYAREARHLTIAVEESP